MPPTRPTVRATQIGEYVRHHSCERRFKLAFNDYELADGLPFFFQLSSSMDRFGARMPAGILTIWPRYRKEQINLKRPLREGARSAVTGMHPGTSYRCRTRFLINPSEPRSP